ncbi:MAG: hypothetical protein MZV70_51015 [Desulfobacterales bacterium]|nr:hypothetical protein [Desulfobacterales bacterium]
MFMKQRTEYRITVEPGQAAPDNFAAFVNQVRRYGSCRSNRVPENFSYASPVLMVWIFMTTSSFQISAAAPRMALSPVCIPDGMQFHRAPDRYTKQKIVHVSAAVRL